MVKATRLIGDYDKAYFNTEFFSVHRFNSLNQENHEIQCTDCLLTLNHMKNLQKIGNHLMPQFNQYILNNTNVNHMQSDLVQEDLSFYNKFTFLLNQLDDYFEYKSKFGMNLNEYRDLDLKFLDRLCNHYHISLFLDL